MAVTLIAALTVAGPASAAPTAALVKDIAPGSDNSSPDGLTNLAGKLIFHAGHDIWKSNGTAAGTKLVKQHSVFSGPAPYLGKLVLYGGAANYQGKSHSGLWRTDGTTAGTKPVHDGGVASLTPSGGRIFFSGGGEEGELWKSDGTTAGTKRITHFGCCGRVPSIHELTNVNGTLFFAAQDDPFNVELYKSNGTATGTKRLEINPGTFGTEPPHQAPSNPYDLTNVSGTLFLAANDGTHGTELWKSNGTEAGTQLVKDMTPGSSNSTLSNLTDVNGTLFFNRNGKLWTSDGTGAGTQPVGDASTNPQNLTNVAGTLYFQGTDPTNGAELWKSNGLAAGTMPVKDINPGTDSSSPSQLTNVAGTAFFRATDPTRGTELWESDGTDPGTQVADINPGAASSIPGAGIRAIVAMTGQAFFPANDGTHGSELWKATP
jgi:ELWxxDGT repeat protein